jgi:hypothetical protein
MSFNSLPQLVAEFDRELLKKLFGEENEASLKRLFGPNFELWLDMFNRLYTVVQRLNQSSNDCLMLLTKFLSIPPEWSVHSLALIVEQVDPTITRMILEMIEKISANEGLKTSIRYVRKYQYEQPPPPPGAIQNFVSYKLYDSLPKMIMYWRRLHAVPRPILSIPAIAQRFPFCCSFQVARTDVCTSLPIRQMMLCISAHYKFAVSKLFSNRGKPRISRQMEQVLREYFGDKLSQRLLQ